MNRRNFLCGVFGGVTAAGLIVAAKPADIQAYASLLQPDTPLLVDKPVPKTSGFGHVGEHLYNSRGEIVALVKEIRVTHSPIDVTALGDFQTSHVPGMHEIEIFAIGIGTVQFDGNGFSLRGR